MKGNLEGPTVSCSCTLFERCGILCAHALKGLDMMNIKEIPNLYLLKRWSENVKDGMVQEINKPANGMADSDMNSRYRMLCPNLIRLRCRAAESLPTTNMLMAITVQVGKMFDNFFNPQDSMTQEENEAHVLPCTQETSDKVAEVDQALASGVKGLKKKEGLGKGRPRKRQN